MPILSPGDISFLNDIVGRQGGGGLKPLNLKASVALIKTAEP